MFDYYTYVYWIDGVPEYVGKGKGNRALAHMSNPSLKYYWGRHIAKALREKRDVQVKISFWTDSEDCAKAEEIRLIAKYGRKDLGLGTLFNLTNGGDGGSGCVMTPEARAKISRGNKGKPKSAAHRKNIGLAQLERTASEETKVKMSIAQRGKQRPKISVANKGRPITWDCNSAKAQATKRARSNDKIGTMKFQAAIAIKFGKASPWPRSDSDLESSSDVVVHLPQVNEADCLGFVPENVHQCGELHTILVADTGSAFPT